MVPKIEDREVRVSSFLFILFAPHQANSSSVSVGGTVSVNARGITVSLFLSPDGILLPLLIYLIDNPLSRFALPLLPSISFIFLVVGFDSLPQ
jgi:hypothetical protein